MINKLIASTLPYMPKRLIWLFSKSYIAGETIDQAMKTGHDLNKKTLEVTFDILGEFITDLGQAEQNTTDYIALLDRISKEQIVGNVSVKPTSFGLLLDEEAAYQNIKKIVQRAAELQSFVRIDMEDSSCVDKEINLYLRLKEEFPTSVGLVLQAYLKRTAADIDYMLKHNPNETPLNFRLCKGIYVEPAEIAYKAYDEVNQNFLLLLDKLLENGAYVGIATHDKYLVQQAYHLIEKHKMSKETYEFQMLYGVTPKLRTSIVERNHRMRVYIPYGVDWFGYSTRRLKENPKMAGHIIKAIFMKG